MKFTRWFIALSAAFFLPAMPLGAQVPSILESRVERHQGPPLWISAEAVVDEQKIVNLDLLDSPALEMYVENQRRELGERTPFEKSSRGGKPLVVTIPPAECKTSQYSTDQSHRGGPGSKSTLTDLADNSQAILRGTIRTIDWGFDRGVPASLLGIEVSVAIKGSAPQSLFYVLYPVAHFRIGPLYFCNTRQGFEPRPGDQILLFDYTGTVDRDHVVFAPHLNQILFQGQDGSLFIPTQIRDSSGMVTIRTLDDVIGRLDSSSDSSANRREGAL